MRIQAPFLVWNYRNGKEWAHFRILGSYVERAIGRKLNISTPNGKFPGYRILHTFGMKITR